MEEATTIRVGHSPFSNLFIIYGKFPIDFLILIYRPQFIHEFVIIGVSSLFLFWESGNLLSRVCSLEIVILDLSTHLEIIHGPFQPSREGDGLNASTRPLMNRELVCRGGEGESMDRTRVPSFSG